MDFFNRMNNEERPNPASPISLETRRKISETLRRMLIRESQDSLSNESSTGTRRVSLIDLSSFRCINRSPFKLKGARLLIVMISLV